MKKHLLAITLVAVASGAMASDQDVAFSGFSTTFDDVGTVLEGGSDVISFTNLAAGTYDFALDFSGQFIRLTGATMNGQAAELSSLGSRFVFAGLEAIGESPFTLVLTGTVTNPIRASYSGSLSVTPVPEPETYAMLLAGLGAMAFMRRRRQD